VNLYELLNILVEGHTWNHEGRKADALQLIRDLESVNALGTVVGYTEANAHAHVWVNQASSTHRWMKCSLCQGETVKVPYMRGIY
jgi:hypothetical protein